MFYLAQWINFIIIIISIIQDYLILKFVFNVFLIPFTFFLIKFFLFILILIIPFLILIKFLKMLYYFLVLSPIELTLHFTFLLN